MIIDIIESSGRALPSDTAEQIAKVFEQRFTTVPGQRVALICTDDNEISDYNKQFFGRTVPTDVISVNIDEQFDDGYLWGEIYISTETAQNEARKRNTSWEEEGFLYFIHGLLHLYGFDDSTDADRRRMWDIQKDILEQCGIFRESFVEE